MTEPTDEEVLDAVIRDLVQDFCYYDRKEDEQLGHDRFAELVEKFGTDHIVSRFRCWLLEKTK